MFIANCHTEAKVPDVERRVEQIDRRLNVFHPSFAALSVVFGKGRGAEEDLGPRADEARVEGLDGMDLSREDAAQQIHELIRGPSHTEQEFVRWAFLSLAGGLCLLLPLGLSRTAGTESRSGPHGTPGRGASNSPPAAIARARLAAFRSRASISRSRSLRFRERPCIRSKPSPRRRTGHPATAGNSPRTRSASHRQTRCLRQLDRHLNVIPARARANRSKRVYEAAGASPADVHPDCRKRRKVGGLPGPEVRLRGTSTSSATDCRLWGFRIAVGCNLLAKCLMLLWR